jgi:transposase
MKNKEFSVDDRYRAVSLSLTGKTDSQVSKQIGCSVSALRQWRRKFREGSSLTSEKRCGRPLALNARSQRMLVRKFISEPNLTAQEVSKEEAFSLTPQTLRKYLQKNGFQRKTPLKKPFLSKKHQVKRLDFVKRMIQDCDALMHRLVFSDETCIVLDQDTSKIKIWRRSEDKYRPKCLALRRSGVPKKLMVWGAISVHGPGSLFFIEGSLNGELYLKMLEEIVGPDLERLKRMNGEDYIFVDDNATPHRCKIVKRFWHQKNLLHLDWPANSPDLNPIENLWGYLKQKLRTCRPQPRTRKEFKEKIEEIWSNLTP